MIKLPPEAQQMLIQLEQLRQQYNLIVTQRTNLEARKADIENSLKELEESKEEFVYYSIGAILVKKPREEVINKLKEEKETLDVRINALKKQETSVMDRIKALQQKLSSMLGSAGNVG